jgi:translation initiation factor 2B subunit (eIF-2B alpha/beta/delta family)
MCRLGAGALSTAGPFSLVAPEGATMHVVTCLLRHRGEVYLVRGPDGRWDAISTPVDDPTTAERVARREASAVGDATLVRAGDPVTAADRTRHPFLFDVENPTTDDEWASPLAIRERETTPGLWAAYRAVSPTAATVASDRTHGSAWLSVRALEALRDGTIEADDADAVRNVATALRDARPSMAAVANRVNAVMAGGDHAPAAVARRADDAVTAALDADEGAAARAADLCGDAVVTLSRSGTVLSALRAAEPRTFVAESRPDGEGVAVAERLAREGHDVTLVPDAAVARTVAEETVDAVLVGADAVLADGRVVNKVGTRGVALAAAREGVPTYAVAAAAKVRPDEAVHGETADPAALYDGDAPLHVSTPVFDTTPPNLVTGVVTERGVLDADEVRAVAAEHRANAEWA